MMLRSFLFSAFACHAVARVLDIDSFGAVRGRADMVEKNREALNAALAAAKPGDEVLVTSGDTPYYSTGGIVATGITGVTIRFAGNIIADDSIDRWPHEDKSKVMPFFSLSHASNVTITGGGSFDGQGMKWWDRAILGTLGAVENRPNMFEFENVNDLLLEKLNLQNSPHFHIRFGNCARVVVRYIKILVDRHKQRQVKAKGIASKIKKFGHFHSLIAERLATHLTDLHFTKGLSKARTWEEWLYDQLVKVLALGHLQPEDLNTDGIDPSGTDFHIHDCEIINDDDSIAVKPPAQKMLIENMKLVGFGASIGSVTPHADINIVRNITFRNIDMPGTGKGIYIKSNPGCDMERTTSALIEDITYEDIRIDKPVWWPIWIGPQQQHEPGTPLGEKCSLSYGLTSSYCPTQGCVTFANITLRNVFITDPLISVGVILGNQTNPMKNIVFDNVVVKYGLDPLRGKYPWGRTYRCEHAKVITRGKVSPSPHCELQDDLPPVFTV
eukprot:TRINITY_DN59_c1_g3_i1.p1 TRINITY_DN59_c1_g3~~TRINITY_DN59_c1_g3_i1.p1  ORF type:complete len:499 (+),score=77.79 TRINITY_DN59_c1_g3_i1:190-1686(+)